MPREAKTTKSTALTVAKPIRILRADLGGEIPVVIQMLDGETEAEALWRYDKGCAAKARATPFGFMVCNHCDRPCYVCIRDPWTCQQRQEMAAAKAPKAKAKAKAKMVTR